MLVRKPKVKFAETVEIKSCENLAALPNVQTIKEEASEVLSINEECWADDLSNAVMELECGSVENALECTRHKKVKRFQRLIRRIKKPFTMCFKPSIV